MVGNIILLSIFFCRYFINTCCASNNINGSSNLNYLNDFELEEGLKSLYPLLNDQLEVCESFKNGLNLESGCDNTLITNIVELFQDTNFEYELEKGEETLNLESHKERFLKNGPPCPFQLEDYATLGDCRRAILGTFKQIFNSNYPGEIFHCRRYEVVNWPEEVSFDKRRWNHEDLRKINSKLGEIYFIKKYCAYGKEMKFDFDELFEEDFIISNMEYSATKHVFDEKELEDVVGIEVPVDKKSVFCERDQNREKCARYRLNCKYRKSQIFSELEKILKFQLGAEAVLKLSNYQILNWPENVEKNKKHWNNVEFSKIKSKMKEFIFVPLKQEFIDLLAVSSRNYSEELQNLTFEEVKRKCKSQLPLEDCEELYKYGITNWPEGIVRIKNYWDVAECETISREQDKFTFTPLSSISGREYYLNMKIKLNEDLKAVFLSQHPDKRFNLKAFDIKNWPEDVPIVKSFSWNMPEMSKINRKLADLVFIERDSSPTYAEPTGLDGLGYFDSILMKSWSRKQVYALLLERFRLETENPTAKAIDWSKLNRRDIPIQYGPYKINCASMKNEKFYKNREIVENIHFFKDSFKPSNKRRWETEGNLQSDDCEVDSPNRKK